MSQFRIKRIDTGIPDEWVLRTNDDGATLGDDIVAEDPNDLAAAMIDVQEVLLNASVYAPGNLINPASGVLERIKIIEDNVGSTTLQSAYESGNYINPAAGSPLVLGPGGTIEVDVAGNLSFNPATMRIVSGSQQLSMSHSQFTTSTNNFSIGTTGSTRNMTVTAGNNLYFKDKYLLSQVPLSQLGATTLATTSQSIIGAINELSSASTNASLQTIYNQSFPARITTNLSSGRFIVENGTGNPLTSALEVVGRALISSELTSESIKIGSALSSFMTINASGDIDTEGDIRSEGEVVVSTVRAEIGSLTLSDSFGSAELATNTDANLTTTKQSIFGAINEIDQIATTNAISVAAYNTQHDSVSGNHEIIITQADVGDNALDRFIIKNAAGTNVVTANALGQIDAVDLNLGSYSLAAETLANETHRDGDGTDHSAVATHLAAANPHNTVKYVNVDGSAQLTGSIVFKEGAGTTLTQVGQEITISAAAGSTIQGVYDTQVDGNWVLAAGKELYILDASSASIASFEQSGTTFHKNINITNGAQVNASGPLTIQGNSGINISTSGGDINLNPDSAVYIQGAQFAPNGTLSLPTYLSSTIMESVLADIEQNYVEVSNATNETIFAGTTVSVNNDYTIWTPVTRAYLNGVDLWYAGAVGVAIADIPAGQMGYIKTRGAVTANIGAMDGTLDGEFVVGDCLYIAQQGYGIVRFDSQPSLTNTVTIDGVVFTVAGSQDFLNREFAVGATLEDTCDNLIEVINDTDAAGTFGSTSFRAYNDGLAAKEVVELLTGGTVGDTLTINATAIFGTSVVMQAVALGNKTSTQHYEILSTPEATALNLAEAINENTGIRNDGNLGHYCRATAVGSSIIIERKEKGEKGNSVLLSTNNAVNINTPASLTGGKSEVKVVMLNRNATGKTITTNNAGAINVSNFTDDETLSQYIAERYLYADDRRRFKDERIIKVGVVTDVQPSGTTIDVRIFRQGAY